MNQETLQIWEKTLELIKTEMSPISYETWIKPIKPEKLENNVLILKVDNSFAYDMVKDRHLKLIENSVKIASNKNIEVFLSLDGNGPISKTNQNQNPPTLGNLNPNYTFETFVVGNSNRMAHACALAVAEAPAKKFNPFFLYGGVGLGKTHLMHSIAHYILKQRPSTKVLYVSSEIFTNDLINSIRDGRNEAFRNKYRTIDVLLIDDIQFISEKTGTQEEFFHTFNTLYEARKQIIISSDRPPKEIEHLEARLRTRFEWGLMEDIQQPDYETRIAILKKKAEMANIEVPNTVLEYISRSIDSNIRTLEGAFTKIVAYATLTNTEITLETAEEAIHDLFNENGVQAITPEYIQEIVANHYGIPPEDLRSKKRTQNITLPRHISMYLSRKLLEMPLTKLGEKFGGRDHTTILHGCDKIANQLDENPELQRTILDLERKIMGK